MKKSFLFPIITVCLWQDFFTVNPKEIAIASRDMSYTEMDSNCIFIDTETTGLAGGTGTYVFLVGVGFFQDNSFLVRQFLLKSPADEQGICRGAC